MATTTKSIMEDWITTIQSLSVTDATSQDDKFRVLVGQRTTMRGSRAIVLSATGGRRINAGRTCSDWETAITIDCFYMDPQGRSLARAVNDAEIIVAGLYNWVATNELGASRIEPDLAVASLIDDGDLLMSRTVRVLFEYSGS